MKRQNLFQMTLVLIAGFALLFSGCSGSGSTGAENQLSADQQLDREAENTNPVETEKPANDAARLAEIEKKEAELKKREQALSQREVTETKPMARVEPARVIPAAKPKPEPTIVMVKLPELTELQVEFLDTVSSETNLVGDPVRVRVTQDIMADGLVAIPAGSKVHGSVTEVVASKKVGGQAMLAIRFDEVETPSGYKAAVQTSLNEVGKSQKGKDAATIGGATAGGAILGRILTKDRTKGTLLGGAIGAAAGTVAARRNQNDPVTIDSGTSAVVALDIPVHIAVTVPDGPRREALAENR